MKKAIQIYVETLTNGDMADISSFGRDRILEAMKRYAAEAVREAAERATAYNQVPRAYSDAKVDKQSILNMLNELK